MPEIIKESGGGFTYETEEELLSAMDQLLADPSYRRKLGLRGYQAYRRKWTAEAHLERYLALIRERATTSTSRPAMFKAPLSYSSCGTSERSGRYYEDT